MMKKKLILLTHKFPDNNSEVFLWDELKYMDYDDIYIISMTGSDKGLADGMDHRFHVHYCGDTLKLPRGLKWWAISLIKSTFWNELFEITKKKKLNLYTFKKLLRTTAYGERMIRHIKKEVPFDDDSNYAVYSYWLTSLAYAAIAIRNEFKNCKFALSRCHGHDLYAYRYPNDYIEYQKFFLDNLDCVASISTDGCIYLKERFNGIQYNSIILSRLGTLDYGIQSGNNDIFTIVSCSSIVKIKRINLIIDSLNLITSHEIRWIHYGNGPLFEEIKDYANNTLGNKSNIQFEFRGHINKDKLMQFYKNEYYNLFVNVSETEGIPVSIMEALSFGVPTIATNVGGCSELVDDSCGRLLERDFNTNTLADYIIRFIEMDSDNYSKMRINARMKWQVDFSADMNYTVFHSNIIHEMKRKENK